jgi:hypothetical protein
MMRAAIACTAILMVFGVAACGDEEAPATTPFIPTTDVGEADVDDGDVTGPDGVETDTADVTTDGTGSGDTDGPQEGCTVDDDCDGQVNLADCEAAVCQSGECVAVETDLCCSFTSDCIGLLEPGNCETIQCLEAQCELIAVDNCCKTDADCADQADGCCSEASCGADGFCDLTVKEFCCATSDDCDDGNPITTDQCVDACAQDGCLNLAGPCDLQAVFVSKDFDDGTLQLMSIYDDDPGDNVSVSAVKSTSVSPGWSLYFGDPECHTYYDGPMSDCSPSKKTADESQSVKLTVTTSQFTMDPDAGAFLGFWVNMSAEPELFIPSIGYWSPDYLRVVVDDGSQKYTIWKSTDEDALGGANTSNGEWVYQAADMSPFTNKAVEVSFEFIADDTGNYNINAGINDQELSWVGAYVDSIKIMAICQEGTCSVDSPTCPDDFDGCSSQSCTLFTQGSGGVCGYQSSTPGEDCQGCTQVGDCGNDACFNYACEAGVCSATKEPSCCAPSTSFPVVTVEPNVAYEGFESADSLVGWEVEDPYVDNVSWQVSGVYPYQGASSLYFGNGIDFTADPPNPSEASIWTPWFEVDSDPYRTPVLSFWLYMDTEYTGAVGEIDCGFGYDQLNIWVTTKDGQMIDVWDSCNATGNSTVYLYQQFGVDLSAYGGEEVRLGFTFNSGEGVPGMPGIGNGGEGIFLDDLSVTSICGESPCVTASDCNDDEPCTFDFCDLGECVNTQDNPLCCTDASDCDDGNNCTEETCDNGLCNSNYEEDTTNCCSTADWLGGWSENFENGLNGFTAESDSDNVSWHIDTEMANSGDASANFSDPFTGYYSDSSMGGSLSGRLISPPIEVPPYGKGASYAEFWFAMSTEWDMNDPADWAESAIDLDGDGSPDFKIDELQVMVMVNGLIGMADSHWASWYVTNTTFEQWMSSRVDLADYAGESVQLVFEFTADSSNNQYPGVYIDDISFGTTCLPVGAINCMYGGDCNSSDECSVSVCSDDFKCLEEPKATPECCEPYEVSALTLGFEGNGDGWTFDTECGPNEAAPGVNQDETANWHLAASGEMGMPPKVDDQSLYFGNGVDYGGATNAVACGNALSPAVTLEAGVPWNLDFWSYVDIEPDTSCGPYAFFADVFTIEAVDVATGDSELVYSKPANNADQGGSNDCSKYKKWYKPSVNLDDWAGKSVQFRFHFHTFDNLSNDGKGIAIDDMVFTKGCAEVP